MEEGGIEEYGVALGEGEADAVVFEVLRELGEAVGHEAFVEELAEREEARWSGLEWHVGVCYGAL